jgi:hypothetical protein
MFETLELLPELPQLRKRVSMADPFRLRADIVAKRFWVFEEATLIQDQPARAFKKR